MDPLTNSLAAFTLARTGLRNLSPYGTSIMIAAANAPDLDILSLLGEPTHLLSFVGGPFHSVILAPVFAALLSMIVWLVSRRRLSLLRVYTLALAGLLLRLLLDVMPVYGSQVLYPLDEDWFALGILPYCDPWLLLLLLLYAFWPLLSHFVDIEMGIRRAAGQWLAYVTILLAALYCGHRAGSVAEATTVVRNHQFANETPFREQCYPDAFSLVRVHCVVETESQMVEVDYFTGEEFDATEAAVHRKQPRSLWYPAQLQSQYFSSIEDRLRMPHWTAYPAPQPAQGNRIAMRDLVLAPYPYPFFILDFFLAPDDVLTWESFEIRLWDQPILAVEQSVAGRVVQEPITSE